MGNILSIAVHATNIHDTKAGIVPACEAFDKYPTVEKFCGDDGYRNSFEIDVFWEFGLPVHISTRTNPGFEVIPNRWIIECIISWLNNSRRLSKDYEITVESEEAFIAISHFHTLLRRLCA